MNGFDEVMALVKLVTDAAAVKANLAEMKSREDAAAAREEAAVQAEGSLAAAKAAMDAAIAQEREELRAYRATALAEKRETEAKLERIQAIVREMRQLDEQMRYAVMNHHGLLVHYNPRLMDFPTWEQIDASVLGKTRDAHYDSDTAVAVAHETETVAPDNLIPGSTLTQENPKPRRSMRRVQPDA